MISNDYIKALKNLVDFELATTKLNFSSELYNTENTSYNLMYNYVSKNPSKFITLNESKINNYEREYIYYIEELRNKIYVQTRKLLIPDEVIYIPRYKIHENKWDTIIHICVSDIVREILDKDNSIDFSTLRLYKIEESNSPVINWTRSKNGKNFFFEFQVSAGIKKESLVRKRLNIFDSLFAYFQKLAVNNRYWVHDIVFESFKRWEIDKTLWKDIDHLKRRIINKEIIDESRQEIKFRRLLEQNGLTGQFVHDEIISWKIKYRPDFWFLKHDLIVEYDEKAHESKKDEDMRREKIIKKYLPNITFLRVKEGYETNGLEEILKFIQNLEL